MYVRAKEALIPTDEYIPENIMLIQILQGQMKDENTDSCQLSPDMDMKKSLDRCSWEVLVGAAQAQAAVFFPLF